MKRAITNLVYLKDHKNRLVARRVEALLRQRRAIIIKADK